jgi:hypothetical protein
VSSERVRRKDIARRVSGQAKCEPYRWRLNGVSPGVQVLEGDSRSKEVVLELGEEGVVHGAGVGLVAGENVLGV